MAKLKITENIYSIGDGFLYKILYKVIGIVTVAQHILSSEQHLELGVGHFLAQYAQTLPRVFIKKAYA